MRSLDLHCCAQELTQTLEFEKKDDPQVSVKPYPCAKKEHRATLRNSSMWGARVELPLNAIRRRPPRAAPTFEKTYLFSNGAAYTCILHIPSKSDSPFLGQQEFD